MGKARWNGKRYPAKHFHVTELNAKLAFPVQDNRSLGTSQLVEVPKQHQLSGLYRLLWRTL